MEIIQSDFLLSIQSVRYTYVRYIPPPPLLKVTYCLEETVRKTTDLQTSLTLPKLKFGLSRLFCLC